MQAVMQARSRTTNTHPIPLSSIVDLYLGRTLGTDYRAGEGRQMANGKWQFLIVYHASALDRPWTTGTVFVDPQQGMVKPLTTLQIQEVRERAAIAVAEARGEFPQSNGYIPRLFAQRQANHYLSQQIGFFFTAIAGELLPSPRPVWRFPIQLRLPRTGDLGVLAMLEVDAQTGEVNPLTNEQIQQIQGQANALSGSQAQSPTA